MNNNFPQRWNGDESSLVKTKFWMDIGGIGISPEMLELVGFFPHSLLEDMKERGMDTTQAIEQVFGGSLKFSPLPGKRFEERLDAIIDTLNRILQVKRHIRDIIEWIPKLLAEEWHSDDLDELPKDLPKEVMDLIQSTTKRKYVISDDPNYVKQLLNALAAVKSLEKRIGYYPGIFREANTIFQRMALESSTTSLMNMSIRDKSQGAQYVELEEIADRGLDSILSED